MKESLHTVLNSTKEEGMLNAMELNKHFAMAWSIICIDWRDNTSCINMYVPLLSLSFLDVCGQLSFFNIWFQSNPFGFNNLQMTFTFFYKK